MQNTQNDFYKKLYGSKGERTATAYLESLGYVILENNYKTKLGEIDIIAMDGERYVFVEVKARSSSRYGMPREAVGYTRQKRYRNTALLYLKKLNKIPSPMRFDVLEILGEQINHIKNAF